MRVFKGFRTSTRAAVYWGSAMPALAIGLAAPQCAAAKAQESDAGQSSDRRVQTSNQAAIDRAAGSQGVAGDEIVVTGTLLRGSVAPVGSSVITATDATLQATAAATSNELLSKIPQVSNLFAIDPGRRYAISVSAVTIARPNLRNISPDNASSASTLVLFDGHRVASAGVTQASIDPDLLPTAAIERVEVVTDGGSSTYGADAVGGVINFITRKRFDGVKADARYGFADDYWQVDVNAIAGKDWGSGSAYVAYTYNKSSDLRGGSRDFVNNILYDTTGNPSATNGPNGYRDQGCAVPNFTVGTGRFNGANGTFATGINFCDASEFATIIPEVERHGVMASLTQELSDTISFDARAFYSQRDTLSRGEMIFTAPITRNNRYYTQIPGTAPFATQTATFSLAPALGTDMPVQGTKISEWGFNAEMKADLTENWQLRTLLNHSESDSSYFINAPLSSTMIAAGNSGLIDTAINPYNVAATDPAALAKIINNQEAKQTRDRLLDLRAILEGGLFTLPGGDVRVAVGYEFMSQTTQHRIVTNRPVGSLESIAYRKYDRRVHAAFGEVQIPIFGDENATPGIQSLVLSAQGRYDHYDDFGGTFNPKIGLNYKPVDWLTLRGNWSKSFNAPTTIDQLGAVSNLTQTGLSLFSLETAAVTNDLTARGGTILAIQGSQSNLKPQTAETWSVGFDVEPPILPGLRASLSYYNVKFNGVLKTPSPFNSGIFAGYPDQTRVSNQGLTPAVITDFFNSTAPALLNDPRVQAALTCNNGSTACLSPGTSLVYGLIDFRVGNYLNMKLSGLDWAVNYATATGFGGIDFAFTGNYQLTREEQLSSAAPFIDLLENDRGGPHLLLQTVLGANFGDHVRTQATWSYVDKYPVLRTTAWPQDEIGSFNKLDLFVKYDFNGNGLTNELSLTFNVNNVFDKEPPLSRNRGSSGFENGSASVIGRQFFVGISKKF